MPFFKSIFLGGFCLCVVSFTSAQATEFLLDNTKITHVEFYTNQFSIYYDKSYPADSTASCRPAGSNVVALNSSTDPGKAQMAVLLTAMASGKEIDIWVRRHTACYGDRPTFHHMVIIN